MIRFLILLVLTTFVCSCSAVFEKPITDKSMTVYTPADSAKVKIYRQQFYWDKVDGAEHYHLQICSPDFAGIQNFVLDTIVTTNTFYYTFTPGTYQWRIRAENSGSETSYQYRTLFVQQGSFGEQYINVTGPLSDTTTYSDHVTFSWSKSTNATSYVVEIDSSSAGNFSNPIILTTTSVSGLFSVSADLPKRTTYKWRMYADSSGVQSQYSTPKTIYYKLDTVALQAPLNNSQAFAAPYQLTWTAPVDGEDAYYIIYLYDNTGTALISGYPKSTGKTDTSEYLTGLTKGQIYYWAIQAVDPLNNKVKGTISSKRKFQVSPL